MTELTLWRRFFAAEVAIVADIQSKSLVAALENVPRERFLPPGPWIIRGEADKSAIPRQTDDADPRHVYHCISVAIDPERQLFNGAPTAVVPLLEALEIGAGHHVLHI